MRVSAEGISFGFDPGFGLLDGFAVEDRGKTVAPLHRAPWVGTGEALPPGAAPHLAKLGGDFFCAPFAGRTAFMRAGNRPLADLISSSAHTEGMVLSHLPGQASRHARRTPRFSSVVWNQALPRIA